MTTGLIKVARGKTFEASFHLSFYVEIKKNKNILRKNFCYYSQKHHNSKLITGEFTETEMLN